MGREVSFRTGPLDRSQRAAEAKSNRLIPAPGGPGPLSGNNFLTFTFPYLTLHGAIVVRKDSTGIEDLTDFKREKGRCHERGQR